MFKAETTAIVLRRAKKVDWNRMLVGEEVRMRMETKEVRVGFDRCVEGETESHCETFIWDSTGLILVTTLMKVNKFQNLVDCPCSDPQPPEVLSCATKLLLWTTESRAIIRAFKTPDESIWQAESNLGVFQKREEEPNFRFSYKPYQAWRFQETNRHNPQEPYLLFCFVMIVNCARYRAAKSRDRYQGDDTMAELQILPACQLGTERNARSREALFHPDLPVAGKKPGFPARTAHTRTRSPGY
jgi:hypothetical protein